MIDASQPLRIFLCSFAGDAARARSLYQQLIDSDFRPWLKEEDLVPGQAWKTETRKAVVESDVVLVCLSRSSMDEDGNLKEEIRFVLDVTDAQPEDRVYLIPVKLEECTIPERVSTWQSVDLFEDTGYRKLAKALRGRADTRPPANPDQSPVAEPPKTISEAFFQTIWGWNPLVRNALLIIAAISVLLFVVFKALPEPTQTSLINRVFTKSAKSENNSNSGSPAATAPLIARSQMGAISTQSVQFYAPIMDGSGNIVSRNGQAQYFTEDLGDGPKLTMTEVPGSRFFMGAPDGEVGKDSDERPQRWVTVPSFYLGAFEITQAQWRLIAALPKVNRDLNPDPSNFKGDNLPVENVSWDEVKEFCARLSQKTHRTYRLPTEAEWEYACRANSSTRFAFGDRISPQLVNYNGKYKYSPLPPGVDRQRTIPVDGIVAANGFGLYAMHGNVWEWCEDVYHENYVGAPLDGTAWENVPEVDDRVIRGGSWGNEAEGCRSANRGHNPPSARFMYLGFRVALNMQIH